MLGSNISSSDFRCSKAALEAFTESLALEIDPAWNIKVLQKTVFPDLEPVLKVHRSHLSNLAPSKLKD